MDLMARECIAMEICTCAGLAAELAEAKKRLEEFQRTCNELQHKVRSLEGAKLLWEITRMSMEFQTIKDMDEAHRQRSALEDELHRTQHRARHFESEHTKLLRENKDKDKKLEALEAKLVLLQDKNLMDRRIEELENQMKQLDEENKEHVAREGELLEMLDRQEAEKYELEQRSSRGTRAAFVKEMKQELWTRVNPASWIKGLKKTASMPDVTNTFPDIELLNLLKREVPKLALRPQFNRHSIS